MKHNGTLYGVGVGPGDPELITLKAVRLLRECGCIAIPQKKKENCFAFRIARAAVPEIEEKPILEIDLPMTRDQTKRETAYEAGAAALCEALEAGKDIAFLTLGDPTVYSTFGYLQERVSERGFHTQFVAGVTSFCAAAASLSMPLCADREELHIVPSHGNYEETLGYSGTRVYMKGDLSNLTAALKNSGLEISAAENCGTESERQYRTLDEIPADAGYYTVIIAKEKKL